MEQRKTNMKIAGVDIAKAHLDVALDGGTDEARFANDAEGQAALADWLKARGVTRVGMEATGGYERGVLGVLQARGFETVQHQPIEVRLFARLKRRHAKTDKLDARLIAAATAHADGVKAAADPLLNGLAMRLTAYEQAADLLAQARTYREHTSLPDLKASLEALIAKLAAHKKALLADLLARIRKEDGLRKRFDLLLSLPGVGKTIAAVLLIRMPELGAMAHGQSASLLGVAPFNRESGKTNGEAFTQGGRSRPRRFLYIAALAAKRCDNTLKAFAEGLLARGKPAKVVLVAIMRKLIEAANLVLKRCQPWSEEKPKLA
jgi:transposase